MSPLPPRLFKKLCLCVCLAAAAWACLGPSRSSSAADGAPPSRVDAARARALEAYGRLPLRFEANRGQAGGRVRFVSRGGGYTLLLTDEGAALRLRGGAEGGGGFSTLKLKLEGARKGARVEGLGRLPGLSHYFRGERRAWRTGVAAYERVRYASVYPGTDLVYYGNQGRLEYDFHLAPGADPRRVRLSFDGADGLRLDERGELVISTRHGEVRQLKPLAYQETGGARTEVPARYSVGEDGRVGFEVGAYDKTRALVIDPVLVYSTYLGGTGVEQGLAVAVDSQGAAYVAGSTTSLDFPDPSPVQNNKGGVSDAFVLKLNPEGNALVYATYLGGAGDDRANAVAVDSQGAAYVAGMTGSGDFPRTPGAWQPSKDGGPDAFLAKLNPDGSALAYSTFIGGPNGEEVFGIDVDAQGRAHVTGRTDSPSFRMLPPGLRRGDAAQRSTNAAQSWSPSDTGLTAPTVNAFAFDPSNPNTIYAATSTGVFRSADAGASWQTTGAARPSTAPTFTNAVVVDPSNPSVVYAAGTGGVFKSTDGGALYEPKNNNLASSEVLALVINPTSPTTLYASTLFGVFKTTDGGDSWLPVNNGISAAGFTPRVNDLALDPSNPNVLYAATIRGVSKTIDGGANWLHVHNGLPGPAGFVQVENLAIDPSNTSTVYLTTSSVGRNVFKTTDGGANWVRADNGLAANVDGQTSVPLVNAVAVSHSNSSVLYAGTTGAGVFKSTDGGANWAATNTGLTSRTVLAVAVAPDNASNVYAGAVAGGDAFVLRLNASGSLPEYFRFLGGSENEDARGVALDPAGNAYVVGTTTSRDFPVAGAIQTTFSGGGDAYVTKLDAAGAVVYSTYLGGSSSDQARAVDVNAAGQAYVVGTTDSNDFPIARALQPNRNGSNFDAFVAKLHADGSSLLYSTYLGGTGIEQGSGVAVDAAGNAYVVGTTSGINFPVVRAPQPTPGGLVDAFLTKINPDGSDYVYSTFLGGNNDEQAGGVAVDAAGGAYVVGSTLSFDFPVVNPLDSTRGISADAFLTKIRHDADLSITKADSRDPVMVNNNLTYTLTVRNAGPEAAEQVVVTDTLPPGVSFVSASAGQGSCAGTTTVTCQLGAVAAEASVVVQIVVTPTAQGTLVNTAGVSSDTPDRDASNNTFTQQTRVGALPSVAGRVSGGGGGGLAGVNVTLAGSQSATTTTDAAGFYQFADLAAGGDYTVTPARPGFVFHPQSRSLTNLTADATADFSSVECSFQLAPSNATFTASGGVGVVNVTAPDALCPRAAVSHAPWITVTSGASGQGSGTVTFSVAPTNISRSATLDIAGRRFGVFQELSPCGAPSFTTARLVAGVPGGRQSLRGDFNNDGRPDLALAAETSMHVLLNNGAGGFTRTDTRFDFGLNVRGLALGDFNADGRADLVSVNNAEGGANGNVRLRLGDGAGGLGGVPSSFAVGVNPSAAGVGDFNNDGRPDLAVANADSGNVSVLLGDGAGGFAAARHTPAGGLSQPDQLAVGDYNHDGKADVAVLGAFGASVLPGDGNGNLGPHTTFPAGVVERLSLTAADFDGDDDLDLVVGGNNLTLLLGDGAGGFAEPRFLVSGIPSPSVAVGDVNADGRPDLVAAADFTHVLVLLGTGGGNFAAPLRYQAGQSVRAVAVADFDGDAVTDIAATGGDIFHPSGAGGSTHLLKGTGGGGFAAAPTFRFTNLLNITQTLAGRFDADAHPDLVVGTDSGVHFVPGNAAGTLGDATPVSTGVSMRPLAALDFNRDGKLDFAALVSDDFESSVRVFVGDGAGAFAPASDTPFEFFNTLAVFGDFNRDGNPDMVAPLADGNLAMRLGNGQGGFGAPAPFTSGVSDVINRLVAGDFDGDGHLDLLTPSIVHASVCEFGGGLSANLLRGDGAGGFAPPTQFPFNVAVVNWLAHDFNLDGRDDLAVLNSCNRRAVVMLAHPAGGFTRAGESPSLGEELRLLDLGDFDGDGRTDLAVGGSNPFSNLPSFVAVVEGNGAGGLTTATTFDAGDPAALSVADFDGNGRADLAVTHASHNIALLLNSCPVTPPSSTVRFDAPALAADEADGSVVVNVTREGDTGGAAAVGYSTLNGSASDRSDYTFAEGVLSFAPGETTKSFTVFLTDDAHVEGPESLTLLLSAPAGVALGAPNNLLLTIADNDTSPTNINPLDNSSFFVRQHYRDFLGRDPDADGLAHWIGEIESCNADQQCREVRRINVSAAFFLSIEFQETGYLAYRAYKAAYGDATSPNVPGTVPVIRLREFLVDAGRIGRGVQVGVGDWFNQLEANKNAFVLDFVQRTRFNIAYPPTMSADEFVSALDARAGGVLSPEERAELIGILGATPSDAQKRSQVLRRVAEDSDLRQRETNRAFVLMQYYGYMRRNPDDPQDADFRGWRFWLDKLEEHNGNFVNAEMVKAFITSIEYRQRFGQ